MSQTQSFPALNYGGISGCKGTLKGCGEKDVTTFSQERMTPALSERQIACRRKFKVASLCAKNILNDPAIRKAYCAMVREGQTAYNLALRDYLKSTDISLVISMCSRAYPDDAPRIASGAASHE